MSGQSRLSVLVPLYNEAGTVRTLLERVRAVPIAKEVIVVDDGSSDGSAQVVEAYANGLPEAPDFRLVLVRHERNQGKGAAVRTAIGHMTGDIAVIQDADLEYDPCEYSRLIAPIVEGDADVVYGSRFAGSPRRVLLFWHTVGNRLLTLLSNMCTNLNLTDMETCYKAFRADILRRIPLRSNRFGLEPELTAKVAHLRCRIYEIPISYRGRMYGEGKKIGWRDAIAALWTILRFAVVHDVGREDAGYTTLRRVDVLRRYNGFLWDLMRPFVGRRVLEVGAGTGLLTRFLSTRERVLATELDPEYVDLLRRTFADSPNVEIQPLDLARLAEDHLPRHHFDTVVCSNVLEHIEDDRAALDAMREVLGPGGRVVLIVPAIQALYGSIDRAIHHYRRYSRAELVHKLEGAGLTVEHLSYFNMLGVPGWFLNARVLKRTAVPGIQARLNDWLVPWLRLERRFGPPVGMSLLAVASRPKTSSWVGEEPRAYIAGGPRDGHAAASTAGAAPEARTTK
jgi:glycosyltransferase involved in cell wall biosynthesis